MNRTPELIVAAALAILLALCAIFVSSTAVALTPPDKDPAVRSILDQVRFPGPMQVEMWVYRRVRPIGVVLLVASLLALIASIELLRLRSWARQVLEFLAWFALVCILALQLLKIASRLFRLADSPAEAVLIIGMGGLVIVVLAFPLLGLIFLLRSRGVRKALAIV